MHPDLPPLRILAVEDDPLQARVMRMHLMQMGYAPPLQTDSAVKAEELFTAEAPDLVLLDIHLHGGPDGIALAQRLRTLRPQVPIIFLTSAQDRSTFDRARVTNPQAFLTKPYQRDALHRAIELAAQQYALDLHGADETPPHPPEPVQAPAVPAEAAAPQPVSFFFVKKGQGYVKLRVADICYLESLENYVRLHTTQGQFVVYSTMKELEQRLPDPPFFRIHRSHVANLEQVVGYEDGYLHFEHGSAPISRTFRDELRQRLNML